MARQDVTVRKASPYRITYSLLADRSDTAELEAADIVTPIYVLLTPTTDVTSVTWFVSGSSEPYRTDSAAPFDLVGDSGGSALPYTASSGSHTISAVIVASEGTYTESATFAAGNPVSFEEPIAATVSMSAPSVSASSTVAVPDAVSVVAGVPQPTVASSGSAALTADANANGTTRRVYDLLLSLGDPLDSTNRVMSGQHIGNYASFATSLLTISGVSATPAVMGVDYDTRNGTSAASQTPSYTSVNTAIKAHWDAGGLVTISLHAVNPQTGYGSDTLDGSNTKVTARTCNIKNLTTPGHATYNAWRTQLDKYAVGLADLQSKGVTVIFRPFHEMNASSWWWTYSALSSPSSDGMTPTRFKTLWQQTFDYLTTTKGLHNLLWCFSPHIYNPYGQNRTVWYPGSAYVDIIGMSNYKGTAITAAEKAEITTFYNDLDKPYAMAETGLLPLGSYPASHERDLYLNDLKFVVYTLRWRNGHEWKVHPGPADFFDAAITMNRDEVTY